MLNLIIKRNMQIKMILKFLLSPKRQAKSPSMAIPCGVETRLWRRGSSRVLLVTEPTGSTTFGREFDSRVPNYDRVYVWFVNPTFDNLSFRYTCICVMCIYTYTYRVDIYNSRTLETNLMSVSTFRLNPWNGKQCRCRRRGNPDWPPWNNDMRRPVGCISERSQVQNCV